MIFTKSYLPIPDNMIQDWVKGKLYDLEFSSDKNNIKGHKINLISKINDN